MGKLVLIAQSGLQKIDESEVLKVFGGDHLEISQHVKNIDTLQLASDVDCGELISALA